MHALTFSKFGGPEVLSYLEVARPVLQTGEVLLENKAIGLNYADIYRRKGNYHLKGHPPFIAGYEGAGVVVETRSESYKVGDRIAYTDVPFSNAEFIAVPEAHAIPIPKDISFKLAASVLLQGLTAQYLCNDSSPVSAGQTVLVHAASGGVGQLVAQMCKVKGAKVIGLTRSPSKLEVIESCKADLALLLEENWTEEVIQWTKGKGVDVVFDSVGSTLQESFAVTKEKGQVVFYGMSGGDPAPVDPRMLMDTSKTLTGGDLWSYLTTKEDRLERSARLFKLFKDGEIVLKDPVCFPLSEGRKAHEFLEGGKSASKIILVP